MRKPRGAFDRELFEGERPHRLRLGLRGECGIGERPNVAHALPGLGPNRFAQSRERGAMQL